jgi:lactocepin
MYRMLGKMKKSLAVLFVILFTFSNYAYAETPSSNQVTNNEGLVKALTKENGAFEKEKSKVSVDRNEKVRVIIELDEESGIEYANKKGVRYSQLSETTKQSIEVRARKAQKETKEKIAKKKIEIDYKTDYTTVVSGFSGQVKFGDIAEIESLPNVKNVYISNEYKRPIVEPNMETSHEFIQSYKAWTEGKYKGEGMTVAIIDSGIDPSHRDMVLNNSTEYDLSENEVNQLKAEESLLGEYFTEKIPYGYNYFDRNTEIVDLVPNGSNHGMHVAGIVAANGNPEEGGIKGVAPEAQLLAMKVFSNDPTYSGTFSDVYVDAIDEAVKLGADAINMSLGSVAAFYEPEDVANLAITRAVDNGVVVSVSAGNARHFGRNYKTPFAENPDIGLIGAPGLSYDSIQVASSGNKQTWYNYKLSLNGNAIDGFGYTSDNWNERLVDNEYELVSLGDGTGSEADYTGVDVKGKIVVVTRGGTPGPFIDKAAIAAEQGAAGIIVVDNGTGSTIYRDQGNFDVPFMLVTKPTGDQLNTLFNAGNASLAFTIDTAEVSPQEGRPSEFSSWGTTPSLDLKPEIMAPGGNIYSTLNDDKYGMMSGTSMAAPHVAGGSALIMQYIKEHKTYKNLSLNEQAHLAKVLLMNTAEVTIGTNDYPYSPRVQGAGLMKIFNAIETPVRIVDPNTNEAKVELRDFTDKVVNFTVKAINDSNKSVTYKVNVDVLTDAIQQTENGFINWSADGNSALAHLRGAEEFKNIKVDAPKNIKVPAGRSVEIPISIDLTNARVPGYHADGTPNKQGFELKEDIFVDGFVRFEDVKNQEADLVVPYLGFYGKWDRPSIFDGMNHIDDKFYYDEFCWGNPCSGMYEKPGQNGYLGWDPINGYEDAVSKYAISPNGDGDNDTITPMMSLLRNAKEIQYNILDENGKKIRTIKKDHNVRKNYADCFCRRDTGYSTARSFDGQANGGLVPDGKYFYEIKARVDMKFREAEWQSKKIPFAVDTKKPVVSATYSEESKQLTWEATDGEGIGVSHIEIKVNGENILPEGTLLEPSTTSYNLSNSSVPDGAVVEVVTHDFAGNTTIQEANYESASEDATPPVIKLYQPSTGSIHTSRSVRMFGWVTDNSGVSEMYANGKSVDYKLVHEFNEDRYKFDTNIVFEEDGVHEIAFKAVDKAGNDIQIQRRAIFVDTTPSTLSVDAPNIVEPSVKTANLAVSVQDNFDYIHVYINDSEIIAQDEPSSFEQAVPLDLTFTHEVELQPGENVFNIKAVDLSGKTVEQVVTIHK